MPDPRASCRGGFAFLQSRHIDGSVRGYHELLTSAGCVAIPSYSPADSESAGFLCIAAYVENALFCRESRGVRDAPSVATDGHQSVVRVSAGHPRGILRLGAFPVRI
jgi:hypothetical protein